MPIAQVLAGLTSICFLLAVLAAWMTHVVACIKAGAWFLLLFGIFVPPIGWVHGLAVWFGML